MRDQLLPQSIHCRIRQLPDQPTDHIAGAVWAIHDKGQRNTVEVWAMLPRLEPDWFGKLRVPYDVEVGVAVDG